jgi:hypothetical protein
MPLLMGMQLKQVEGADGQRVAETRLRLYLKQSANT